MFTDYRAWVSRPTSFESRQSRTISWKVTCLQRRKRIDKLWSPADLLATRLWRGGKEQKAAIQLVLLPLRLLLRCLVPDLPLAVALRMATEHFQRLRSGSVPWTRCRPPASVDPLCALECLLVGISGGRRWWRWQRPASSAADRLPTKRRRCHCRRTRCRASPPKTVRKCCEKKHDHEQFWTVLLEGENKNQPILIGFLQMVSLEWQ